MKLLKTTSFYYLFLLFAFLLVSPQANSQCFDCTDAEVLTFYVDLSSTPDTIWTSPSVKRNGICCGATEPPCIRFIVYLNPYADEFSFQMAGGASPPGMEYMVNCTDTFPAGAPICVPSADSLCILYCKPGANANAYEIATARNVYASPDMTLSMGCTGLMTLEGIEESTITWTSISPGLPGAYNTYLSCTAGCDTTYVTAPAGYPDSVIYVGAGTPTGCSATSTSDTIVVYFVSGMTVAIDPADPAICFGNPNVTISAIVSGGAPPYSYLWSTSATTQAISVPVGTYFVEVYDTTQGCPPARDTVTVIEHASDITSNAGPDDIVCTSSPDYTLNGAIGVATGGIWTGGTGTYNPNNTTLNAIYTPSAAEISAGTVTLTLTSTGNGGCPAVADNITILILPDPVVAAGTDQTVCSSSPDVSLNGSVTVGSTTGIWTTSGTGTFAPSATTLNATYTPSAADITAGTVTLTLTATNACTPLADNLIVTILPEPIVDAGTDQTVCGNNSVVNLAGSVTGGGSTGDWSTSGTGTFAPSVSDFNATYTPSAADILSGSVTITLTSTDGCAALTDDMLITITPAPVVDAGIDQTVCGVNPVVNLSGSVTGGSTTGQWTTGGTGTFGSATSLSTTYTPSAADITAGTVNITLTSTANGTCNPEFDIMVITITPPPIVSANADQTVCANNSDVILNGSITGGATTGIWTTSGTGTFAPSATTLGSTYTPSDADTTAGNVTLTLTSTDGCSNLSDAMIVTITPAPGVDAGVDQIVCQSSPATVLSGSVFGGSTTGQWSGGTGTYNPNNTTLNATYTPSAAEITAGTVTLTLTSTANGTCLPVADDMIITISPAPVVDAGINQTICEGDNVNLSGSVTIGGSAGQWTGGTGTFNPNNTTLNATYTPSAAEITAGTVNLTLTATDGCSPVNDNIVITISPLPIVNANIDQTICEGDNAILDGSVTVGGSAGNWTTSGSGSFAPSSTTLNATYTPSASDITAGSVTLTLTSTDGCAAINDAMTLAILPLPVVNAGIDQTVCSATPDVTLSGTVTIGGTAGQWSGGTGTYNPSNTDLNTVYTPSAAEITAGSVILTLTATDGCSPETDNIVITITPGPVVNAGVDQTVCANNAITTLNGSVTVGGTAGIWTTSGTGIFGNVTNLSTTYTPSDADTTTGSVTITLTSTDGCSAVNDIMVITFSPAPYVNAGPDLISCVATPVTILNGIVSAGSSTGQWSGGGGTYNPNNTTLNATYNPTAGEVTAGSVTLTLTSTANGTCLAESDDVTITFSPAPVVDAGIDQNICQGDDVSLSGSVTIGGSAGIWSGGTGTYSPSNTDLNATYTPSAAEATAGFVTLTLTATDGCAPINDNITITITPAPLVNAGIDQTVCANNNIASLNGSVTVGGSTGQWSTTGTGIFGNASNLITTYTPSAADISSGSVTITLTATDGCIANTDDMLIIITPSPVVDAGIDQTVCGVNPVVSLTGSVTGGSTSGQWTSGGTGTFSNANNLSTTYTPSAADIAAGTVNITLTSTLNGTCNPEFDVMVITITPPPIVNANIDQTVCANNAIVTLNGSITGGATAGIWTTSGSGSFTPSATNLGATYTPSNADTAAGTVTLTLTSTNGCSNLSDAIIITITPAPGVDAGFDQIVCESSPATVLDGSVFGGSTTGQWSGGTGTYNPNNSTLNATYTPSAAEISAGTVTLTLTSTSNGTCLPVADDMIITITQAPIVDAGINQTVCASSPNINLGGSVTAGSTTGIWTTSGTGTFTPSATDLNATYNPSQADNTAGMVTLTLTATGGCAPINDNLVITITPLPVVNAGINQNICETVPNISLSGTVTIGGSSGQWSSSGTGTFSNPNNLSTTYSPSVADITAGTVIITLTSTDGCDVVFDDMILTINTAAIVDAGTDQTACSNNATINLSGYVSGGTTTGIWSTSGTGTFSSTTNLNTMYFPSNADTITGNVTITLTSTNNGACPAVNDNLVITLTPGPYVNAGISMFVCANNPNVALNGIVAGASTTGIWTSDGTGTFSPNNTTLNATYIPSDADTANGLVTLSLTSTNIGTCFPVTDTMTITITPAPTAIAGSDIYICNTDVAQLDGQIILGAGTGTWTTTGTGTFNPNANSLNAIYTPSGADTLAGSLQFTLTSTNNGGCNAVSDILDLYFTPRPNVDAGIDQIICANNTADLTGLVTGSSTTGIWTTSGTGTFTPSDTSLNATYIPSVADGIAGSVILILNATYACYESDNLTITLDPPPVVDAGTDFTICETQNTVSLTGSVTDATTTGIWTTTGTGNFTPSNTDLNATYNLSPADISSGYVSLMLASTNNGDCLEEIDTVDIYIENVAIVDAGLDVTTCSNNPVINLNGSVSGGTTTGIWTTTGTGTFNPGDVSLIGSYIPTFADTAAGSITITLTSTNNGTCAAVNDNLTVTFTSSPWVAAGPDQTVCSNNADVILNGSITGGASQGIWTTSGTGTFTPSNTDLNATYIPSIPDTVNGIVTLVLTSTDNGDCNAVSDTLVVIISDSPLVDAGADQIICSGDNADLYGIISSVSDNGIWTSSGDGTFSPDNTTLTATYIPGVNDTANGTVTLTLTSTNVGNCNAVSDNLTISITPRPLVDAGTDETICSNATAVLIGSVSGSSTTGIWTSSGTGTFSPSNTSLSATYFPSSADTTNGSVYLILSSTNSCLEQDSLLLTMTTAPFVDAGTDVVICASDAQVNLTGTIYGATTTGIWTTDGTGTFTPDNTTLNAIYNVTPADTVAGFVNIILTSTNNGTCQEENDTLTITITNIPVVDAGADQTFCANTSAQLAGNITGIVTTGMWTSSGTGTFVPNNTDLNAVYIPSAADTTNGSVNLTLESVGSCQIISDVITLTITSAPWVDAGIDQTVCANNANVNLAANIWGATTTGVWTTSGTGTFNDNTDLNGVYYPSNVDTTNGIVELILESSNNGTCIPSYDTMIVTISDIPLVEAGNNMIICSGYNANLVGSVISSSNEGIWTTSGDGSFSPNNTNLTTAYVPGATDVSNGFVTLYLTSTNMGNCSAVYDSIQISITPEPFVDAGIDQTTCSNNTIQLSGSVSGSSTTGYWSTSGTGTFTPDSTDFNAIYIPSEADTANGGVTIYLIATNSCNAMDSMEITLTPAPWVDAGPDEIICASEYQVPMNGNIWGATTTGVWTTLGTGVFTPSSTNLSATYNVSSADSLAGFIELVLISTNNGTCQTVTDTMSITITDIPTVDAGIDQTVCANNDVVLYGIINGIVTTGMWTSSGDGYFTPDSTDLNASYVLGQADTAAGYVNIVLESVGSCQIIYDTLTVTITPGPWVNAGPNISVCANNANVDLSGLVWGATTTGVWSTNGSGTFSPSNTDLNSTYIPSNADTAAGSVILTLSATNIGTCSPESDNLVVTFTLPPIADAGPDVFACNDGNANLNGIVLNGNGTGIWTTNGTGTFASDTSLSTVYYPSVADTIIGSIEMYLTTTNNGGCLSDADTLTVTFTPRPYVYAGADIYMCSNDTAQLSGIVSGSSTSGIWSSLGSGTFFPDSTNLVVNYIPSIQDADSGFVAIILTSTNACSSDDTLMIEIVNAPIVDAGANEVICYGVTTVNLSGSVTGIDSTGVWTTLGTGAFVPSNTSLNATYILSSADTMAGSVNIILTSTGAGFCGASSDTMTIIISDGPTIDAGLDIIACANNNPVLSGTSSSTNNIWSTSGTGYFSPDSTDLNATYVFSNADTTNGFVSIYLWSTNSCGQSHDTLDITITPAPYADAGMDISVCANYPDVSLNGIVSAGATTGQWTSNGNGTFLPSDTDLNATYIADSTDTVNGSVILYLTSTNNGDCNPVTDSIVITINPTPLIFAGVNQTICNGSTVDLTGVVSSIAGSGIWTSSGNGTFSPNDTTLNATYIADQTDLDNGEVMLILEATNLGSCYADADTLIAYFMAANSGIVIGNDHSICFGDSVYVLPIVTGDTGTVHWTSSGTGTFLPSDSVFNITYIPDSNDVDSGIIYLYADYHYVCGNIYDSIAVAVNPIPNALFATTWNCKNMEIGFADTSEIFTGTITSWEWDLGNGSISNDSSFTYEYSDIGNYDISMIVHSDSGCVDTAYGSIHVWEPVIADFSVLDTNVMIGVEVSFTDESSGPILWYWDFGDDVGTSSLQNPTYTFETFDDYIIWLYIDGESGCRDSMYITMHTIDNGFGIPSGFTPNGDNLNDKFGVRGGPFVAFELRVFNSWGQQIFMSNDQANAWDGTFKGKAQPEGVYIYVFIGEKYDGTRVEQTGDVTLIR